MAIRAGSGQTVASVASILKNPAYAGAFVFGRTRMHTPVREGASKAKARRPIGEWRIVLKDRYPAYIDWPTYEKIWATLSSDAKWQHPLRFDIGKVVQDLKECCHAILFASVGGRERLTRTRELGRPVRAIERNEISPSPASAVMGVAPEDDLNSGFV